MNGRTIITNMSELCNINGNLLSIYYVCSYPKTDIEAYRKFVKKVKKEIASTEHSFERTQVKSLSLLRNLILRAQGLFKRIQDSGIPFELEAEYRAACKGYSEILKDLQS